MIEYAVIQLTDDLSEAVRSERRAQGLSQTELAERSGCSQRFVSEFERGKQTAEVGKVLQLLAALGLGISITRARTAEQSRALVDAGIGRIQDELNATPRPRRRLADYLREA